MKKHTCQLIFSICIGLFASWQTALAQAPKLHTSSKAAEKSFLEGTRYFDNRQFDEAIRSFKIALKKDSLFPEAHIVLAEVMSMKGDWPGAMEAYRNSIRVAPDFFPNNYMQLAIIEYSQGQYDEAIRNFQIFKEKVPNMTEEQARHVELGLQGCAFAKDAIQHPVPFEPKNLGPKVNSSKSDYYPTFTVDQKEVLFTRDIDDVNAPEGHQEDFYMAKRKDSTWMSAVNVGGPLNTGLNEGAPSISADGRLLFYTACNRPDGKGSCDIYLSQRMNDGSWSKPLNIGAPINSGAWESQPSFSSDGKSLYFVRGYYDQSRNMKLDIFVSEFQADRTWSNPVKLSDAINTEEREESVFIHPDNSTLYFSSNGRPGMGGLDIYMSRRQADGSWGPAQNLGFPINTPNDENSLVVSADGKTAYFASNREGGYGDLDLYEFPLVQELRPMLVSYVKARVIDAETKNPLSAAFEIIDIASNKTIVSNTTDQKKGEFMACLPAGKDYMLNVNKESYLFYSDHFECSKTNDEQHAFELLIPLKKPKAGEKVLLKNVFFETAKYTLKPESKSELDRLFNFLKASPAVRIEIAGHTDNIGDAKSNQELSNNRAKAVYDYLIAKGIAATQLAFKGYGAEKPIATNDTEEGRAMNRRTEFTIL